MIFLPIMLCMMIAGTKSSAPDKFFPDFTLDALRHPLYQTAYLNPETGNFTATFATALNQQKEFEGFMQFNNYTNTKRTLANGTSVPSYLPPFDTVGPNTYVPLQCISSVDYKYSSTVIGIIKNGNQLEEDLLA